jgi:signal transduction histidine kinase
VEKKIDPELPAILGDPVALRQVLENLVGNAAKHGSDGHGWIGVFASAAGGPERPAVEIRVADRGAGIPQEERERIFDPFYRGRRAIAEQVHGTGLGLSLVRRIVEAHGGNIRVESDPGKGTEFIVRIPAATVGAPA